MTAGAVIVIVLGLVLLSRAWVRSSRVGAYHTTEWSDGHGTGPRPREDDDARWHWDERPPRS